MSAIRSAVSTGISTVVRFFMSLPGKVLGALASLSGALFRAGQRAVSSLIDGITSKIGAVGGAIGSVAAKIKGFFHGSPVEEGPLKSWNGGGAGVRLMASLAEGIQKGASRVTAQVTQVAKAIADALKNKLITKAMAESMNKVVATAKGALDKVKTLTDSMKSFAADVGSKFLTDPFGKAVVDAGGTTIQTGLQGLFSTLVTDIANANAMTAALKTAAAKGLEGGLFKALASSGDLDTAQGLASSSRSEIARLEKLFNDRNKATQTLGNLASNNVFGKQAAALNSLIGANTRELAFLRKELGDRVYKGARDGVATFAQRAGSAQHTSRNQVKR